MSLRTRLLTVWLGVGLLGPLAALGAAQADAQPAPDTTGDSECTANGGALVSATPEPFARMQLQLAWQVSRGDGVLVAVVDSGVDASNPHLAGALAQGGVDLVGDGLGANGYTDTYGHGTAVAALIAAREIPGSGLVGIAPNAKILPVRVYASDSDDARKQGTGPRSDRIAQGIRYAADAGAQIINVSMSDTSDSPALRDAVAHATARGALVVASAGNATTATDATATNIPVYPAADDGALAVAAVDRAGNPTDASFSGPHVDIAAVGQNVLSAVAGGKDCYYAADAAQSSFSTAYVSGSAALVAAAYPDETPAQWTFRLTASAVRPDPDHRDDQIGWGIVQPYDALTLVPGVSVRGPADPFASATPRPSPSPSRLTLTRTSSPWRPDQTIAATAAALTVVVVGVVAPVQLLRRRRQSTPLGTLPITGGLYGDPPPEDEDDPGR